VGETIYVRTGQGDSFSKMLTANRVILGEEDNAQQCATKRVVEEHGSSQDMKGGDIESRKHMVFWRRKNGGARSKLGP
jgi:hypothetical protein